MASRKIKVVDKSTVKQPRHELLQVVEIVAREKNIDKDEALNALECAIQKAAKAKYGLEHNIRVNIDKETGDFSIYRVVTVVEKVENPISEISLEDAKAIQADAELGFEFTEKLPSFDFGRSAVQGCRQIIMQKIREAEREHQYVEFVERKGEILNGLVKHVDYNQVVVDIGGTEGVLQKEDNIPRQTFHIGDRVKALLVDIRPESRGPMLILSRTHNAFVTKLFEQEVTEVYDGSIKIMSVARDPGSRAKMAVYSPDNRLDPVGSCVGVRGSRVQAVMAELQGEKIDVIPWSSDPATYVMNALSLKEIKRVVIDEEEEKIEVVIDDEFLSQAIGRRGQNVRLASILTGWKIEVVSDTDDTARRTVENAARIKSFMENLAVDEIMAQLLISEGFTSVEDVAQSALEDFIAIEGFDENIAKELRQRAIDFVKAQEASFFEKCQTLKVQDDLLMLGGLDIPMFNKLIESGITALDDVANLSSDELLDIVGRDVLSKLKADAIIMEARKPWFEADDQQEQSV